MSPWRDHGKENCRDQYIAAKSFVFLPNCYNDTNGELSFAGYKKTNSNTIHLFRECIKQKKKKQVASSVGNYISKLSLSATKMLTWNVRKEISGSIIKIQEIQQI